MPHTSYGPEEFFSSPEDEMQWRAAAQRLGGGIAPSMKELDRWAAIFRASVARRRAERLLASHEDCIQLAGFQESIS